MRNANQRRHEAEMRQLEPGVTKASEADLAFFGRHPERRYRIRRAHSAKIRRGEIAGGQSLQLRPGQGWFSLVHHLGDGCCVMVLAANHADAEVDLSDRASVLFRFETEGLELPIEERLAKLMGRMMS